MAFGKSLDGVTEHRPWHLPVVLPQKLFFRRWIPLANFAQHPADRLVNQIFLVGQQLPGNPQGGLKLVLPDQVKSGNDGNPSFPEILLTWPIPVPPTRTKYLSLN